MDITSFEDLKLLFSHEQSSRYQRQQGSGNRHGIEAKRKIIGTTIKMQHRKTVIVGKSKKGHRASELSDNAENSAKFGANMLDLDDTNQPSLKKGVSESFNFKRSQFVDQVVINKDTEMLERQYKDRMRDRELDSAKKVRGSGYTNPEDAEAAQFDFEEPAGTATELNTYMIN